MIYMDCTAELFCILDGFCKILNASLGKLLIANQNKPTPKSAFPKLLSYNQFIENYTSLFTDREFFLSAS